MDKFYQLSITDNTTSVNMSTVDPGAISRMLELAGLPVAEQPTAPVVSITPNPCAMCGSTDHGSNQCASMIDADDVVESELDEEQAEYDHGHQDVKDDGHEIDQDDYVWKGSSLPQRLVKGTLGDNPLIAELHATISALYKQYLEEEARENDDGMLSPLSDPTKPEFDKDPLSGEEPVDDGSHSPLSTIKQQPFFK